MLTANDLSYYVFGKALAGRGVKNPLGPNPALFRCRGEETVGHGSFLSMVQSMLLSHY